MTSNARREFWMGRIRGGLATLSLILALAAGPWGCETAMTPDLNPGEGEGPAGNAAQSEGDNTVDQVVDNEGDNDTNIPPPTPAPVDFTLPDGAMVVSPSSNPPEGFMWTGLSFEIGDQWTGVEPLPGPRMGARAVALDGYIYVIGGNSMTNVEATMFRYDPRLDEWTQRAPLPSPRYLAGVCAEGGLIFVVSGSEGSPLPVNTLYAYDPFNDSWETLSDVPVGVLSPAVAAHAGKIYCAGGHANAGLIDTLQVYDIASDTWSSLADLPYSCGGGAAGVFDGQLYIAGGHSIGPVINPVGIYDIAGDSWSEGAPPPMSLVFPAGAVADGKFFLLNGPGSGPPGSPSEMLSYDPVDDKWETWTHNPNVQFHSAAASVGNDIYFFGGAGVAPILDIVQRYTVSRLLYVHEPE